ncbi:nucleotide-binding universal stress UspA family protein [Yoonia maricola]|uniref:Nucleotide-binding universal stress UspA family protein n=1 Tax=Yoonia maricola TaxID=420999 RepID=A0A2M8W0E2_9RHOB|nr:universal stress protein [Yoonia maricola]PJI84394.1 nucleotide-binding universal stress UspA family protein [Yoonia maricola]
MFDNITIGVDGSDHGWRAFDLACDLAQRYDAQLHVVHVPEIPPSAIAIGIGAIDVPIDLEQIISDGQAVMADAATRARAQGVEPSSQIVRTGVAATEILHVANSTSSDLIVSGRRGMGDVASLFLGSTSHKIAQEAQCACLTVK